MSHQQLSTNNNNISKNRYILSCSPSSLLKFSVCILMAMNVIFFGGLTLTLFEDEQISDVPLFQSKEKNNAFLIDTGTKMTTRKWDNWPAVAHEEIGFPLVTKGDSFFNQAKDLYFKIQPNGQTLMDEFLEVYKNRPDPVNLCGIRINHALALFLAVKHTNPTLVVESGVNAGVSTYFIRSASSTTRIFAIDPLEKPICNQGERWVDPSNLTTNFTGKNFVDLMALDWKGMVSKKEIFPESTLVFIDDHLHAFKRIASVMKVGVRHVVVEDNYKYGEGTFRKYIITFIFLSTDSQ